MSLRNGDSSKFENNTVEGLQNRSFEWNSEQEDSNTEAVFRGFEKIPYVRLARLDLTPYLNKKPRKPILKKRHSNNNVDKIHLEKLVGVCSIHLVNYDLEKLKRRFDEEHWLPDDGMANLKCKICEKAYSSDRKLQNHQVNKHMIIYKPDNWKARKKVSFSDQVIVHEVKEYHKCRKCSKIFENYKMLKVHMKGKHKKRKCYICNYCLRKFVDRMFFKVHIKLHCDICSKLFPNKSSYLQHRRDHCRVFKLHKCKTCNESFFRIMDLKDHSYEHTTDVMYVCDICKDQFETKCAIAHHISFLHSKSQPSTLYTMHNLGSDRLYLCNFCDESSVVRDSIESHVQVLPDLSNRVMTGYKDFYFCDQCFKKFDTESSMLQHKWTHFLKTSDLSQERTNASTPRKLKYVYKTDEKIPEYMLPNVVVEKLQIQECAESNIQDITNLVFYMGELKKPIVDPKSKKTIISRHQCQTCGKYYSSNYCLSRHIQTQHDIFDNLQCKVCEETFVWPSLLQSHKCIRLDLPEMPFEDARPEIHFDGMSQNGLDDFNIIESDDYNVDFEIPAPIVQLTEYDGLLLSNSNMPFGQDSGKCNNGFKLVMQEVPIEF